MDELLIELGRLVLGLILLIKGADLLVDSSSRIAKKFGISELMIGLTLVAAGTSFPEAAVSIYSAVLGKPDISVGNIVGSNIFNIAFILGSAALWGAYRVYEKRAVLRDMIFLIGSALLFSLAAFTGKIDATAGLLFLSLYILYLKVLMDSHPRSKTVEDGKNDMLKSAGFLIFGFAALFVGADWTVSSASTIALAIGISEWVISATVIAAGTSFPELAVSAMAFAKKKYDISIGNIVGSNIVNILLIMGVASLLNPLLVDFSQVGKYFGIMILITGIFSFFLIDRRLSRIEGMILIGLFTFYILSLFYL